MPRFRVRFGQQLGHDGTVHEAGAILELPRHVADDTAVRGFVEEIDNAGELVTPPPADELARFRTHERIGILQRELADADARVSAIKGRLEAEERRLEHEVAEAAARRAAAATPAAAANPAGKTPAVTRE